MAATSTIGMDGEERGDLINFYNNVFLPRLQKFSKLFMRSSGSGGNQAPPLSPLPQLRAHPMSPCKKVSDNHSVFIRNLKSTPGDAVTYNPHSPHKPLTYSFSRSPAKDLVAINVLMNNEKKSVRKRLLADETSESTVMGSETMTILTDEMMHHAPKRMILQNVQGVQVLTAAAAATAATATAGVNNKLESILGDRVE